jgi:UDP-N-acetylglucosamine 4,6-dehydratase
VRLAITGISGTLAGALIPQLIALKVEKVIGLSRDEGKQAKLHDYLQRTYGNTHPVRLVLGDVRDERRLERAFYGCDAVIHCAAMKLVDQCADNPSEALATNVIGSSNVIHAALAAKVGKALLISTDKAVQPSLFYGQTKAMMEGLAVASNTYTYPQGTKVSVVRYGNVMGSRGSVLHTWRQAALNKQPLSITDHRMTRFWLTQAQAAEFVIRSMNRMQGGEIMVPVLPTATMVDFALAVNEIEGSDAGWKEVGLRTPAEKLHEMLIAPEEVTRTRVYPDNGDLLVEPSQHEWTQELTYVPSWTRFENKLSAPFCSETNKFVLNYEEVKNMIRGVSYE